MAYGPLGRGCVNSQPFQLNIAGAPKTFKYGELRFMDHGLNLTIDPSGETYCRMTYRARERVGGWRRMIANKGLRVRDTDYVSPIPIVDDQGRIVTTAQYLTADGRHKVVDSDPAGLVNFVVIPPPLDDPPGPAGVQLYQEADLGTILFWDLNS